MAESASLSTAGFRFTYQHHSQGRDGGNGLASLGMSNHRTHKKTNGLSGEQTQQHSCPIGKKGASIVPTRQWKCKRVKVSFAIWGSQSGAKILVMQIWVSRNEVARHRSPALPLEASSNMNHVREEARRNDERYNLEQCCMPKFLYRHTQHNNLLMPWHQAATLAEL